jgi:hypothetical protein
MGCTKGNNCGAAFALIIYPAVPLTSKPPIEECLTGSRRRYLDLLDWALATLPPPTARGPGTQFLDGLKPGFQELLTLPVLVRLSGSQIGLEHTIRCALK